MKIITFLKYVIRSASYGVMLAVVLLLLIPELRDHELSTWNIFQSTTQRQEPLSYAKAVNTAGPAVVNIYSSEIQNNPKYGRNNRQLKQLGSGVIMDSGGYILTNFHVVQDGDLIEVLLQNGRQYAAELIGFDIYTDLAVLKVNGSNLPVIPQNSEQIPLAGDVVLAIGNPLNLGQTVTQGIISATGRAGLSSTSYLEFLQIDAAINKGNSGGALVNTNGELIGINSRQFTEINPQFDIQGISFAVPYHLAYKVMQKIIENGRVIRGWLGITSTPRYLSNVKGIVIDQIAENSPALAAGLKPGDIILQIGEVPITSITQALDIVADTRPNTTITFKIYRQQQHIDVPVTIVEKK
ncbi:trypsin-like peptidase domain-containing protein [Colwelliaceae bacterium 6471]